MSKLSATRIAQLPTLTCSTIFLICGSKPMSSMRSASSSTRYVHRRRFVFPDSRRSSSRPGVAMQISAPAPQCNTTLYCQSPIKQDNTKQYGLPAIKYELTNKNQKYKLKAIFRKTFSKNCYRIYSHITCPAYYYYYYMHLVTLHKSSEKRTNCSIRLEQLGWTRFANSVLTGDFSKKSCIDDQSCLVGV